MDTCMTNSELQNPSDRPKQRYSKAWEQTFQTAIQNSTVVRCSDAVNHQTCIYGLRSAYISIINELNDTDDDDDESLLHGACKGVFRRISSTTDLLICTHKYRLHNELSLSGLRSRSCRVVKTVASVSGAMKTSSLPSGL